MTCNPFASVASRNSISLIRPESIDILDFQDILDFEKSLSKRFCKANLSQATKKLNGVLSETDLRNHPTLSDKLSQSPLNTEEVAEFLVNSAIVPDDILSIIDTEYTRRRSFVGDIPRIKNTIKSVSLVGYQENPPSIHQKVGTYLENNKETLRGNLRGTIDAEGRLKGTISDANISIDDSCSTVSGSGSGVEGIEGIFKIEGVVDGNSFSGRVLGGVYDPGFVVIEASLQVTTNNVGIGASFNVVIGPNGLPIVTISNSGSNYGVGDILVLDELGVRVRVDAVVDQISPEFTSIDNTAVSLTGNAGGSLSPTNGNVVDSLGNTVGGDVGTSDDITGLASSTSLAASITTPNVLVSQIDPTITNGSLATLVGLSTRPIVPVSDFSTPNYPSVDLVGVVPNQAYIDLVNSLEVFFADNYGDSVSSGVCGSSLLGLISGLFSLFDGLKKFQVQIADLTDIWDSIKAFPTSLPSLLTALQATFEKIIDNLMAKATQTIENVKSSILSIGTSVSAMMKEIVDLERFYSNENKTKIKNLANSIMQKMYDQFDNTPIDIISWILTRLCQLSSFISNFLQTPIKKVAGLIDNNNVTRAGLINLTNANIEGATQAGAVRLPRQQLVAQANAAATRSNRAGDSSRNTTNRTPSRITAFPISDEERAQVAKQVTSEGWQGIFIFSSSVKNNNYGPEWGERFEGAGWRVIVRDNPVLFAKIQKIVSEVGGGPYTINSAFRSEEYNSKIPNAALRSAHTEALALDIKMTPQQAIKFVPLASANGFNGIAYYMRQGFLHVDMRTNRNCAATRSWSTGGALPSDLQSVINNHKNKLYSR